MGLVWLYNISVYVELVMLFFFHCSEIKNWGNCIPYLKFLVNRFLHKIIIQQNPFNCSFKKLGPVVKKDSRLVTVELIAD